MARILGVEIADGKRAVIGLTGIYGIGLSTAQSILQVLEISFDKKIGALSAEEKKKILAYIAANYKVEGALRAEKMLAIKRLMDMGCYIGKRHRENRTVRGQRTKNNGRTKKGAKQNAIKKKR